MDTKYTKTMGVVVAIGILVLTLTNATTVFSQVSEATGLTSVFKKVSELELLAASSQQATTLTQEQIVQNKLTKLKNDLYPNIEKMENLSDEQIANLLNQFLNTDEARASEELFLAVAFANFPLKTDLILAAMGDAGFTGAGDYTSNPFITNAQSAFAASSGGSVLIEVVSRTS